SDRRRGRPLAIALAACARPGPHPDPDRKRHRQPDPRSSRRRSGRTVAPGTGFFPKGGEIDSCLLERRGPALHRRLWARLADGRLAGLAPVAPLSRGRALPRGPVPGSARGSMARRGAGPDAARAARESAFGARPFQPRDLLWRRRGDSLLDRLARERVPLDWKPGLPGTARPDARGLLPVDGAETR